MTVWEIVPTESVGLHSQVTQPADSSAALAPPSTIVVYALGNGMAEVNRQPVAVAALGEQPMSIFHARPESTVFVGGKPDLEFQEIARVIDSCKGAGIRHVGLLPKDAR